MKVIEIPYCFYPDPIGGTEVYVESVSKHLQESGIEVIISAPTESSSEMYFHDGLKVRRFAISQVLSDLSELYGEGDLKGAIEFAKILDEEKPNLVHFHAFTRGASLRLVREAKKRGIKVVFTYHSCTVSCPRGTMLRWGRVVCDGKLYMNRCTICRLHSLGLPRGIADVVGMIPLNIVTKIKHSGGIWTALRMRQLISLQHATFFNFMSEVDSIISVCEWVREVLLRNGIPKDKVMVIRQGLSNKMIYTKHEDKSASASDRFLRVAYLGRLHWTKGIDILIRAVMSLRSLPVELNIYGIIQSETEREYLRKLKRLARGDTRIIFNKSIPSNKVVPLLRNYDVLAVPSQWLETGPLVTLEAFAAGIPVIGSNLGGIAELVKDGVNGILVKAGDVKAWSEALRMCSKDRKILEQLRAEIHQPKTMDSVAEELKKSYAHMINS